MGTLATNSVIFDDQRNPESRTCARDSYRMLAQMDL